MNSTRDDKELHIVDQCKRGERDSLKMLYKHFYGYAMSVTLRYSRNYEDAVEVLNDGFMKIFKKIDTYNPEKSFKAWLRRIMINTALDHIRANEKYFYHEDIEKAEYQQLEDASAYSSLTYNEILEMVQELSPAYRTVFNLYAIDGYTHAEIGEMLGISEGTSKSNLFKARAHLKEILKKRNKDEYAKYA